MLRKSLVKAEGLILVALTLVELILELDPMQTQSVQAALHQIHHHHYSQCHTTPYAEAD